MTCPKCGGEVWDNGPSKAQGKIKPNAPDLACKNKEGCGWKQWPAKGGGAIQTVPTRPQPLTERPAALDTPDAPLPWETSPKDEQLVKLYWNCFDIVLAGLKTRLIKDGFHDEQVAAMTATLYIARSKLL